MIFAVLGTIGFWICVAAAMRGNGVSLAIAVLAVVVAFAVVNNAKRARELN